MAFKMNKIKASLNSYPQFCLMGTPKIGKTTFFRDLVLYEYKDPSKGLLISCGSEEGYHALDQLQVAVASSWSGEYDEDTDSQGLVSIIDEVIDTRKETGIQIVAFDTLDTMADLAEAEVCRLWAREAKIPIKNVTINSAFGGYGKGLDKEIDLILEQIARLRAVGIAVFILSHTKLKEKSDMYSGEKYEQITNNLQNKLFTAVESGAQMVCTAIMERDIQNGKITNERRRLYLVRTSQVDAGCRFPGMPESIEFTPEAFMNAFRQGVKNAMFTKPKTDEQIDDQVKKENAAIEKKADKATVRDQEAREADNAETHRVDYIAAIQAGFSNASDDTKAKAKELLSAAGVAKFSDPELDIFVLKKIASLFV